MADRNAVLTTNTKLSFKIFSGTQRKCNHNTGMVYKDSKPAFYSHPKKHQKEIFIQQLSQFCKAARVSHYRISMASYLPTCHLPAYLKLPANKFSTLFKTHFY